MGRYKEKGLAAYGDRHLRGSLAPTLVLVVGLVFLLASFTAMGFLWPLPLGAETGSSPGGDLVKERVGAHLIWLHREDEAVVERIFKAMEDAGMVWLRTSFGWSGLEPSKGQWDWEKFDIVVEKAREHGIKLLGILSSTPAWASSWPGGLIPAGAYPPVDMNDWNNYVHEVCSRYGPYVEAWEIWNEQNTTQSFSVASGDRVATYMNLVKRAHEEIRKSEVDPDARIVLGGVAGYDPGFIEACLKKDNGPGDEDTTKGAADYVDAVAFHPYPFVTNLWTGNPHPHEREMREKMRQLHSLLNRPEYSSGKELELWITEIGWTNSKDQFNPLEPVTDTVDEGTQAAYSLRTFLNYLDDYMFNVQGDCTVDKIFYYNLWGQYDRENTAYRTYDGGDSWTYIAKGDFRQDGTSGLNAVSVLTENIAWAVGHYFSVGAIGTSDGGTSWIFQTTPTNKFLHGVSSVAQDNTAFAVGEDGTIIKIANQSNSWTSLGSGTAYNLNGVCAVSKDTVWVVGDHGVILKTVNGGANWIKQVSGTSNGLLSVSAVNADTAWAVGIKGTIVKTENGGSTWVLQNSGIAKHLRSVSAVDGDTAWAVGEDGTILKTVDGGSTWASQSSGSGNYLNGISAVSRDVAWAVGDRGTILKTTDGGMSWHRQTAIWSPPNMTPVEDTESCLMGVDALDAAKAWIVGYRPTHAPVPITAGDYSNYVRGLEKYGMLHSTFIPKPVFNYLSRLVDDEAGEGLFDDAVAIPSGYLFSSTNAPSTLEKHLFRTGDGSLLLALWNSYNVNSNAFDPANDPDATLSFTLKNPSGSAANPSFDNPLTVNLMDGTVQPTGGVSRDASGNITVSNLSIGKVPVILKFRARAGAPLAVYSLKPGSGLPGMEVTIDGCKFGDSRGSSSVKFDSVQCTGYTYWSDHRIKCLVPNLSSGNVQVTVATASGTSNAVPFKVAVPIDSILPNRGNQGSSVNITNLVGDGFQAGATVSLEMNGQPGIAASNVAVVSPTQITCTFNLSGAAVGSYDVVVTNPDGTQGRLLGGFTVNTAPACGTGSAASLFALGVMLGLASLAGSGARRRRLRKRSN
jgi:photosystem II stability/assembly factor-like uncharacterized protein